MKLKKYNRAPLSFITCSFNSFSSFAIAQTGNRRAKPFFLTVKNSYFYLVFPFPSHFNFNFILYKVLIYNSRKPAPANTTEKAERYCRFITRPLNRLYPRINILEVPGFDWGLEKRRAQLPEVQRSPYARTSTIQARKRMQAARIRGTSHRRSNCAKSY